MMPGMIGWQGDQERGNDMTDDNRKSGSADPFNPLGLPDLQKLLEQMQVPGVDFGRLTEDARKNIEALQEANQAAAAGWQALAEKQREIFQETMQRWQEAMTPTPDDGVSMERQAELAREGFERAIENMRELAQIAADSQSKTMEIMRERFEENLKRMMAPTEKSDE
jgi:phasin family protein